MNEERIGNFIKKIRLSNHQTQKEFADKYNVSFQAVSKWENGKCIPDITLLKQICKDNNISIDELLGNEPVKRKNKKLILLISTIAVLLIIMIVLLVLYFNNNSNFEFKKISTSCSEFIITGSAAYNKDKSSIYISNIEFCGENDNIKYQKIEYALYESDDNKNTIISSGEVKEDITLEDYLKKLKINVNNYTQTCKYFSDSKLYIEINATDNNSKITTYKIPITLEENCEK